jgi:hypothetical protein
MPFWVAFEVLDLAVVALAIALAGVMLWRQGVR